MISVMTRVKQLALIWLYSVSAFETNYQSTGYYQPPVFYINRAQHKLAKAHQYLETMVFNPLQIPIFKIVAECIFTPQ